MSLHRCKSYEEYIQEITSIQKPIEGKKEEKEKLFKRTLKKDKENLQERYEDKEEIQKESILLK